MTEEEQYILEINDDEVRCHRPDGTMDSLSWKNLSRVEIVVTEDSPLPATFIALHGPSSTIVIPEGATNADDLSERLFTLDGFDADTFVESMSAQTSDTFVCWTSNE
ncbi:MAG: hypothetical protein ACJ0IZ_09665 [Verrucomicrobiales bacterium]|nr:hypothetical protein [Verrucomicrobiales bacterium]